MKTDVTIKDIAEALGIHHATVSRALKGNKKVKEETRQLVLEKANELGYMPNILAQSFRNKRMNIITIIVPDLKHHFFSRFVSDITELAHSRGFMTMIFQSNDDPDIEKKILESLISLRVAGIAASIGLKTTSTDHFNILKDESIPLVFFDRAPLNTRFSTCILDNYRAIYTLVDEMIKRGRKNIAYISYDSHLKVFTDRLAGYKKAVSDAGLSYMKYVSVKQMFIDDGYNIGPSLFNTEERPDAIICVNDEVAIGVMKYLKANRYSIPRDISLAAFDNNPLGTACEPELTTFSQSTEVLAEVTFELLSEQITNKEEPKKDIVLPMDLIIRGSL